MVLEKRVVELLLTAKHVKEVKIINGHKPEHLTRVINGENIGTIIRS